MGKICDSVTMLLGETLQHHTHMNLAYFWRCQIQMGLGHISMKSKSVATWKVVQDLQLKENGLQWQSVIMELYGLLFIGQITWKYLG